MNNRLIRTAAIPDIANIMKILDQNLVANKPEPTVASLEAAGFLIHGFSADELEIAILDTKHHIVLVVEAAASIIGYELSYDLKHANPGFMTNAEIAAPIRALFATEKILYHRHIAKQSDQQGVGKLLLQALEQEAIRRGYHYIVCQIAHKPFKNIPSIALHELGGFQAVSFHQEDEITFGVYLKQI